MAGLNQAIIIGHLGKDPELREVGDTHVCNFSVATTRSWYDKKTSEKREETQWHRVTVWGKSAESCAKYLTKGRQVCVTARIEYSSYEKDGVTKYSTDLIASDVQFLGGRDDASGGGGDTGDNNPASADKPDDIPF